uniref:Uncharacterized protein n=1 Tax=Myotis myotis TaxID=51298 RepID=A0A7J7T668_MYOMY|nr:hypothetical protein mMyoMyo1_009247 [Myotis myotis]
MSSLVTRQNHTVTPTNTARAPARSTHCTPSHPRRGFGAPIRAPERKGGPPPRSHIPAPTPKISMDTNSPVSACLLPPAPSLGFSGKAKGIGRGGGGGEEDLTLIILSFESNTSVPSAKRRWGFRESEYVCPS